MSRNASNAFEACMKVEARSMEILTPFLRHVSGGSLVLAQDGPLAEMIQKSAGDALINVRKHFYSVEVKAEERHTGNVFLETVSNFNRDRWTWGWLHTIQCDFLGWHFLDNDTLYVFDFRQLRAWLYGFEDRGDRLRLGRYPCKEQKKYRQLNDTRAVVVAIQEFPGDVLLCAFHPVAQAENHQLFGDGRVWPELPGGR